MAELSKSGFCMLVLAIALAASGAAGELLLPSVISDGMVLQRNEATKIWGWATPGASIEAAIGGRSAQAVVPASGRWTIELPPLSARGPHSLAISGDGSEIEIRDVLVGEVWVCSGQSNMQWSVARSGNPEWEIENGNHPLIRMFSVTRTSAPEPQQDCEGSWQAASSETVARFSAVGYYFARNLHQRLGVPIGMLHTSWGGTPVESWTSAGMLARTQDGAHILDRFDAERARYDEAMAAHRQRLAAWQAEPGNGERPEAPRSSRWARDSWRPSGLFNAMVAPLIPYTIQGAIWYQGESNAQRAYQYRELFPAMIRDWRAEWKQGAFPFYFVQLANFKAGDTPTWPELREAQNVALKLPNTGTAVTIDIGDRDDIHPKNKQEVGRRLSLIALSETYGAAEFGAGPQYRSIDIEDNRIRVHFDHASKGLAVNGAGGLHGFEVAGTDGEYHAAMARIDGETVMVWSDAVPRPAAVRYAWANDPIASLYNGAGLPASPFRSDDWPAITAGEK